MPELLTEREAKSSKQICDEVVDLLTPLRMCTNTELQQLHHAGHLPTGLLRFVQAVKTAKGLNRT